MKDNIDNNGQTTRKEEIIIAAAKIFASKGYHAATLDEIAAEIGISKPALYYHIKNKEEILKEIISRIMEPMESVAKMGRSDLPPRKRMGNMIRMLIQFAAERKETTQIALELNKMLPKRSHDALKKRQKDVEQVLQDTLSDGMKNGDFTVCDTKIIAFAILAVSNSIYRWYQPDGKFTHSQIADHFIKLLEHGYLKQ